MASDTIKLYVDLNALGGAAAAGAQLMVTPDVATDSEGLINPKSVIYTMDEDGLAEIDLNVNPMYPVKYTFALFGDDEKKKIFSRHVSAGVDVSLKELFEAGVILPVGELIYAYVLGAINAVKQLRGTASTFGLVRVDGTSIVSVNGVLSATGEVIAGSTIFISGETPIGAVNGSNATFTTEFDFIPESVSAVINGLQQKPATHFTTSGTTQILFSESPQAGDQILINYTRG